MPTLVERAREVVSAVSDDFYTADTILYYLNRVQDRIASIAIVKELSNVKQGSPIKSLRCLDGLRTSTSFDITSLTVNSYDTYYKTTLTTPSDLNQYNYMRYKTSTILREITDRELYELEWGNRIPSAHEGYIHFTGDAIEVYLNEDLSGGSSATNYIYIHYVKNPTALTTSSEEMTEIPEQLENALIYGAATMMVLQEGINDPNNRADLFNQFYQEELKSNLY
jgi:hypothetical protein